MLAGIQDEGAPGTPPGEHARTRDPLWVPATCDENARRLLSHHDSAHSRLQTGNSYGSFWPSHCCLTGLCNHVGCGHLFPFSVLEQAKLFGPKSCSSYSHLHTVKFAAAKSWDISWDIAIISELPISLGLMHTGRDARGEAN